MPKDFLSADLRNKAGITTKPFLVNLTFWEDRPRLNFWEKILLKRKQLAKQAKNEAKEEEISAYMAEVSAYIYSNSCEGRLRRPCTREIHSVSRTFKPIEQNYCKAAPAEVKFIKSLGLLNNLNRITW